MCFTVFLNKDDDDDDDEDEDDLNFPLEIGLNV